jgi:hypothetical protein
LARRNRTAMIACRISQIGTSTVGTKDQGACCIASEPDAYFSREHFDDRDGCCPLLGTASDVQRRGEVVKAAYQEVVEQLVKVFENHLNGPRARERALALVALCVGGMVLARNVCDPDLADDFRRTAHAEVLRTAGWN